MYKVKLRKPYGKILNEIATFVRKYYAIEFANHIQKGLYDVVEVYENEKLIYKAK